MWPGSQEGLFVGEDNWVAILCGTSWGPVDLFVRKHDAPPEAVDQSWDMAAEWSLDSAKGNMVIQNLYSTDPPHVVDVDPGWIRLRVSVRDRKRANAAPEPLSAALEQHLLELWPEPTRRDPTVVHGPDDYAQFLR